MKIYYAGTPGTGYGWGVCNTNLRAELSKIVEVVGPLSLENNVILPHDAVFMPLADHDFNPVQQVRGKVNLAYTFFEFALGPNAAENAKKYDVVFAGSSWCLDRMRERGITNGQLLIQGVDRNIFKATPPRKQDGQFRIFSGGKFEYRKGQDLVIAAFKQFAKTHPDAHLVCSWFNPWTKLIADTLELMGVKTKLATAAEMARDQLGLFSFLCSDAGVQPSLITILHQLSQPTLAAVMRNTDIGLFPNRCEGGTNLVLMEYASCGRKVVANAATGHADVAGAISYEIPATNDENHWAVQSVEDIVAMLELAYENRETPEHWSLSAHRSQWTWEAAAKLIWNAAKKATKMAA